MIGGLSPISGLMSEFEKKPENEHKEQTMYQVVQEHRRVPIMIAEEAGPQAVFP